jgi:hypothetical protein
MMDFDDLSKDQLRKLNRLVEIRDTRIKFAKEFHRNTRGEKMDFVRFPHVRDWYESLSPVIVMMGAAQVLKSEWMVIDMLANSYCGCNCFTILPKYEMRDIYAQTRVKKPLMTSPEYKKIVAQGGMNSTQIIEFGKGMIKFVGANVESDFVEYSADSYYVEETDKISAWDNVEMGRSRYQWSIFKFQRYVSNPSTKDGQIYKMYLDSDQRIWNCLCDKCGEFSQIDWFDSVVETKLDTAGNVIGYKLRDESWRLGCGRDIRPICPKCGSGALQRFHESNHWQPQNPESKVEGYHVPSVISAVVSVEELWEQFRKAESDPSKMQIFYNMRLGLPYTSQGNSIPVELLASCTDPQYNLRIIPGSARTLEDTHPGPCSMGVDVSDAILDVRISHVHNGKRRAVFIGKLAGASKWEELLVLGERYNVQCCFIDASPTGEKSIELQELAPFPVWRVHYQGAGVARGLKYNSADRIVTIDRTIALDKSYSQLKTKKNILPANFMAIYDGGYVKEMTSLVRQVSEQKDGTPRFEWAGSPESDHSRHSDTYDLLAAESIAEEVIDSSNFMII